MHTLYSSSNRRATRFSLLPTAAKFKSRSSANIGSESAASRCFRFFSFASADAEAVDVEAVGGAAGLDGALTSDVGTSMCATEELNIDKSRITNVIYSSLSRLLRL
jgi:hypothetical protein